jgi:hypothetical protein
MSVNSETAQKMYINAAAADIFQDELDFENEQSPVLPIIFGR